MFSIFAGNSGRRGSRAAVGGAGSAGRRTNAIRNNNKRKAQKPKKATENKPVKSQEDLDKEMDTCKWGEKISYFLLLIFNSVFFSLNISRLVQSRKRPRSCVSRPRQRDG